MDYKRKKGEVYLPHTMAVAVLADMHSPAILFVCILSEKLNRIIQPYCEAIQRKDPLPNVLFLFFDVVADAAALTILKLKIFFLVLVLSGKKWVGKWLR